MGPRCETSPASQRSGAGCLFERIGQYLGRVAVLAGGKSGVAVLQQERRRRCGMVREPLEACGCDFAGVVKAAGLAQHLGSADPGGKVVTCSLIPAERLFVASEELGLICCFEQ